MNEKNGEKNPKKKLRRASRECAYLAVFVALTIAAQLSLSFLPGVEVVTLLFVAYAYAFGARRGMLAATAFALLRQLVFGFFPVVLILYLLYYNLLTFIFGLLGQGRKPNVRSLWWLVPIACLCTVGFTMLDNLLTPLWYGYSSQAARMYFFSSLPFMIPQVICTAVTVGALFLPLEKEFQRIKKGMVV